MGWILPAMMAAGAISGYMGGKDKERQSKIPTTTTSQTDPWRGADANYYMDQMRGATDRAMGINWGPSLRQNKIFDKMYRGSMGGGGRGGGGGGGQGMYGSWRGQGGGGGGGGQGGIFNRLAKSNVAQSGYEQRVLGDEFLNVQDNPYVQAQIEAMQRENAEQEQRQYGQAMSPFMGGGDMGFSGAQMGARMQMADQFSENWQNQQAQYMAQQYQAERQLQDAANQAWSQREATYDASGFQNQATRAAARMAANASMYGSDQQLRGVMAGVGEQSAARQFAERQALFGMAGNIADMRRQQQGIGQMGVMGQYGQATFPWQQGFGKTTGTKIGPPISGGGAQGMFGGLLQGMGMGMGMGK